jgi:hypothetical protein
LRKENKRRNVNILMDVKKTGCTEMEIALTQIWGRMGTGERHSREEIKESVGGGLEVKVFA